MSDSGDARSALVVQAALSVYLGSARTPRDWAEFVESLQHALSHVQHATPAHQVNLATGGVDLPKNGLHGAAAAVSGLQSTHARFEALLDELYLTQGYRNSHHTTVASNASTGSSLENASLTPLRFLSATCYRSLKDLFLQQDPTLEAIFMQYRDVGGAANPSAYADFLHSLVTLSQRWKRYIFFPADSRDYLRQARALFGILEDFLAQKLITYGEYDFLENMLYNLTAARDDVDAGVSAGEGNLYLLAAWANCWESLQTGDDPQGAVHELYDSILHLLENQIHLIYRRYTSEATDFLRQLNANYEFRFAGATLKHLMTLIHQQAYHEERKRRGITAPLTPAEQRLEHQSTLLFACFAESAASQNVYELIETLQTLGNAWRKTSPHINLLECLRYLESHGLLTSLEYDAAELLVYEEDSFVLAAWSIYEEADYSKRAFDDLLDSVRRAVDREFRAAMTRLATEGYRLVNAWSVAPDPRPVFHADPLRDQVVGIQRLPNADLREFVLPPAIRGSLSAHDSEIVRALLAARDSVLLALIAEFEDTHDLDDLLDGIERCIARAEFGTASARARSTTKRASVAANVAPASSAGEFSSEEALDVYQLSQMLVSLQSDGYLSHETLLQLLYAVQDRNDPVLLAAFALYKESLQAGNGTDGWPELWDTLQRVYQRIQRDNAHVAAARDATARGASSFLPVSDALLLRHVGTALLDQLSSSQVISITDTLYLRDLLRDGDPTLYAILALAHSGEVDDEYEVAESLRMLGQRWIKELDAQSQLTVRVLHSLADAKYINVPSLDYLLGLVYARDPTLAAVAAEYTEAANEENPGTDSEQEEAEYSDSDDEDDEEEEEEEAEEEQDDDDEEDDEDDDDDEDEDESESEIWSESEVDERKYESSGRPRPLASAPLVGGGHRRTVSTTAPRSLAEFVDSLNHILESGQRTILQMSAGDNEVDEDDADVWEQDAQQVEASNKDPQLYGFPYQE